MEETPPVTTKHNDSKELALIRQIAGADQAALGQLYDRMGGWIYSLAFSIVKNQADAEEVTQEVFLTVWKKAPDFSESRGSVRAWLAVMTRHLAIDRTRGRQFKESIRSDSGDALENHITDTPAVATIQSSLDGNYIGQAMQLLEEPQRRVLYMSYYEGYSHSEIAQRLDLPVGTVKSRIRSGVNRLRGLLEEEV